MSKSKTPKLTPWFRGQIPARHGVYQMRVRSGEPAYFSYWDGSIWRGAWQSAEVAFSRRGYGGGYRIARCWRGLATPTA